VQYTTQDAVQAEKDVLRQMQKGQDQSPGISTREQATALADMRPHLNSSQRTVIEQVLTSKDQVQGLHGLAGTGKTTTLEAIREGAMANGYAVEGFAPTSRAARQLVEAGVSADTLQGFLGRGGQERTTGDPSNKHFYIVDESSLASTQQMREFLSRIGPQDKVLLVGDIRQHQGVNAGKPFEDLQNAGMRTAQLDQIIRQKEPGLLQAVEHFSKNETSAGVALLQQQGRVTEVADPQKRVETIAKDYVAKPEGTIIISPDNASRLAINQTVRQELQAAGTLSTTEQSVRVLTPRSDMTGASRTWAAHYEPGDVLLYQRGSKELGIDKHTYAHVVSTDPKQNTITVAKADGDQVTYDPVRLRGVTTYREMDLPFAMGDRIQFTAPNKELGVVNRELGTIEAINKDGFTVRLPESNKSITFDPKAMPHIDHGYAVTSHSSQGLTTTRVIINVDSHMHPDLLNTRLAYVSTSRATHDVTLYTNDAGKLGEVLSRDVSKSSAIQIDQQPTTTSSHTKEPSMNQEKKEEVQTERISPQGLTPERVTINIDSDQQLNISQAYVPASRATEVQPEQMPASIYASQLPPEVVQRDISTIEQGLSSVPQQVPANEISSAILDDHWNREPHRLVTAAEDYASNLYTSVKTDPFLTPEQRIEQMQPTQEERQKWEPLIHAVPLDVADQFSWNGNNGTVQSYQHEDTQKYLHIDGPTGQFYDRDKNPVDRQVALDHALPVEMSQQYARAEQQQPQLSI
jgi:hypothetical protein